MKLPKWTTTSLSGDYQIRAGGRGGSKSSSIELLTPESEFTRESSNLLSSVWKPVWYTGWHTGVLACAGSALVVLCINVGLTIYAAANPKYKMEGGVGTLYSGSCDKSRTIGMWLHLGINVLSTLLLSGSNYTQQCLAAPTRKEVDAAHARKRWMDIGIPSVRNLFRIKPERTWLWIAIGATSIPLHLLYNSAVYTSIAANGFIVTIVTNDHFEPLSSNMTEQLLRLYQFYNISSSAEYRNQEVQLFSSVLEGYSTRNRSYEYLTTLECAKLYNTDFLSNHRNLFLIAEHSSNATHNNTVLGATKVIGDEVPPSSWMCAMHPDYHTLWKHGSPCSSSDIVSNVTRGLPWRMELGRYKEIEISGCRSETVEEKCKVQFSLWLMIVVICCNLVKVCGMIMTVVRSQEPTLVTLGDAVDSFLRTPDSTTIGMCFADRRLVKKEWRVVGAWWRGPRQWKQKGVQRWWTSVSKTRWITCNFFCSITIIAAALFLAQGMAHDRKYWSIDIKSMWTRGFGKVNSVSLGSIGFGNITQAIVLANLPQTILSFLYLTYNSIFTCMLSGHEWSLFSHHHRTLRVTSPRPGQRSTYWLQIPYTYAIPLMTLSGLLHWLTSQSIFLARVEISDPLGVKVLHTISAVGYSCIAIISVLALSILALLAAAGIGYKRFAAEITTVGGCSVAISAACHNWGEDPEGTVRRKVRWGDVGIVRHLRVRHLAFSSEEGVQKPIFGEAYAGTGRGSNYNL